MLPAFYMAMDTSFSPSLLFHKYSFLYPRFLCFSFSVVSLHWGKSCFPLSYCSEWRVKSVWEIIDPQDMDSIMPMITLSTWGVRVTRDKSRVHRFTVHRQRAKSAFRPCPAPVILHYYHLVFYRQFLSPNFHISQIQKSILTRVEKNHFQLWQNWFCPSTNNSREEEEALKARVPSTLACSKLCSCNSCMVPILCT